MKLEQTLEMCEPTISQDRQRIYTIVDLESLSASALYTGEPCDKIPGAVVFSADLKDANSFELPVYKPIELPPADTPGFKLPAEAYLGSSSPFDLLGGDSNKADPVVDWQQPSKIFDGLNSTPLVHYDPADKSPNHSKGHLHMGYNPKGEPNPEFKGISAEDSRRLYGDIATMKMIADILKK